MDRVERFVEDYRETWDAVLKGARDAGALTPFFHDPCTMVDGDGNKVDCRFGSETEAFNANRRAALTAEGAVGAAVTNVAITPAGQDIAMAVVDWELRRADGATLRAVRHTYTIFGARAAPRILVSQVSTGG